MSALTEASIPTQTELPAPAPQPPPGKASLPRWFVGTLAYTTGGLVLLFFWLLLGDFALNLRDRSISPMIQLMLENEGVSDTAMALLISSLPPLLGLLITPIVSYRSDRLRSRWGRRIPFLIVPTPLAALAMVGIAFTPALAGALHEALAPRFDRATCVIAVFGVFWTCFEVAAIVSLSVFGGLINDVVPRPVLGRFFALFRAVSLMDGILFNYFLIKHAEAHSTLMFIAIAVVFGVGFVLMCFMVKEGTYPPPPVMDGPERAGFFHATSAYFRECFTHRYYLWIFATFTLAHLTFLPINLFSIRYAKALNMDMGFYGKLIAASYAVSLVIAYPLGMLVDRFHALRAARVAMFLYVIASGFGAFFIVNVQTFAIAFIAHTILSGTYFTTSAALAQCLLPRSRFTQFASAASILTSLSVMSFSPLLGVILDHTDHNYQLTFIASFILACVSCVLLTIIYRKFLALGGRTSYIAPGDQPVPQSPKPA